MAYIKIFPIKATVKNAVNYITDSNKTEEKTLVSSFACSSETADIEFAMTREIGKRNVMDKGDNLAFHLIQSFKPGEVDAETAHKVGQEFANAFLKGRYEYVLTTHTDKDHIHNHLIFNATNFVDYHKYVSNQRSYHHLCRISNRICKEYGLTESMPKKKKAKSYKEHMEYKQGTSWKSKLKVNVDKAIWSSTSFEEFLQKMKISGYEIKQGKNLAFRAEGQKKFTYMKSLGNYYSDEKVRERLEKNRSKPKEPRKTYGKEIRIFIDISSYVIEGDRAGFDHWAKLNNLKEAAKTFNYLSEHNLLNYENFQQHSADLVVSIQSVTEEISEIQFDISEQRQLQKQCQTYRLCRKIVEEEKDSSQKIKYRKEHQGEYQLHDSIKKELVARGIKKIPSDKTFMTRIEKLEKELSSASQEKDKLLRQQKTLNIVQQNFETLLHGPNIQEQPQQQKQTSL